MYSKDYSCYKKIKRFLDLIASIILLLLLSPVFLVVPLIILITMGPPVIFRQKRVGLHNRVFQIYKFRTMRKKSDDNVFDSERITYIGRILRITRIDEFPQLYNILIGDMSFLGPRPLIPEYLPYYEERELHRHDIRPGLSGLSQVSGSYPGWEEQFEYDLKYVKNINFGLDLKIFFKTFIKVINPTKKLTSGRTGRLRFDEYRKRQRQCKK
jgi:undecaprenyl phosphate N,N'-diacetylbacillosamine 1-phosphate transferase